MKKPKLQEQITKLYQTGAQQELRMKIRKLIKENLQEWEERFLKEDAAAAVEDLKSQGMSNEDIWHELKDIYPGMIDSVLDPDSDFLPDRMKHDSSTPWFKRDFPHRQTGIDELKDK